MKFDDDDDSAQPIYEHPPDKYSAEEIIKILLDPPKDKICYVKPTLVTKSAAYIVDTSSLHNLEDIKKDSYGIWKYSGSHPQTFKVYTYLLFFTVDAANHPHHCCLVVYRLPSGFVHTISSHGNSKDKKPFFPTWPSTRKLIENQCLKNGPKATIEHVSSEVGGMLESVAPGQLPRSEKQVTNIQKREKM